MIKFRTKKLSPFFLSFTSFTLTKKAACCALASLINGQKKPFEIFKGLLHYPAVALLASEVGARGLGKMAANVVNSAPASPLGNGFHGNVVAVPVAHDATTTIPFGYYDGDKLVLFRPNANTASLLTVEGGGGSSSSGSGSGDGSGAGSGDASPRAFLLASSIYFTPGGKKKREMHGKILLSVLDRARSVAEATNAPVLLVTGGDLNRTPNEMVCLFVFSMTTFFFFSFFLFFFFF